MNAEHTPGPWETFGPGNPQIYGGDPKRRICVLDHLTGADMSEDYANARLIATAPETAAERDRLKAINKELLDALRKIRDFGDNEVYPYNQTIEIARTAIKKAEGL